MPRDKKILILNGSLHGQSGNTARLLEKMADLLAEKYSIETVDLASIDDPKSLKSQMQAAAGFIVGTGTYWQSWGSPLQKFLEETTDWEATDIWVGKPAAALVTMHAFGGMEVLARLQSIFNMMGALIPPMCGMVYSALAANMPDKKDLWQLKDLSIIAYNFSEAINGTHRYQLWDVDRGDDVHQVWLK